MQPLLVRNDRENGQLLLHWPDGREQPLPHRELRLACPCAFCRSTRMRGAAVAAMGNVRIKSLHAQGYGVQIVFDDGHDRGIFPWEYLAALPQSSAEKED